MSDHHGPSETAVDVDHLVPGTSGHHTSGHQEFTVHSPVSDPGRHAALLDALPADVSALRDVAQGLVFHYRANGDLAGHGIAPERIHEIDTRSAERILTRLVELSDQPLDRPRTPAQRVVGCCRDFTLLLVAMARQKGIPARSRTGFAAYVDAGWFVDHVVAEIWDATADDGTGRWLLVEPQLPVGTPDPADGATLDLLDIPRDRFLTGPDAWLACRAGDADPARFVVAPGLALPVLRSWPYLAHNLVHDLAALNRRELLLWDAWGTVLEEGPPSPETRELMDRLATVTADPDPRPEVLASWLARPEFRIPDVVTSYSPCGDVPLQVAWRALTVTATPPGR